MTKAIREAIRSGTEYPTHPGEYIPDATCFAGLKKLKPDLESIPPKTMQCPKCKGYGGWVLRLNTYPTRPPYNGRQYSDFRSHCSQCHGWGYVVPGSDDAKCVHEYRYATTAEVQSSGYMMFAHDVAWCCNKCGKVVIHDASG